MPGDPFLNPPDLVTPRLIIRPIRLEDAEAVHRYKSDIDFARCYAQEPKASLESTRLWIESNIADQKRKGSISWAVVLRDSGKVVGDCCYWNFDADRKCAEIGYEMIPEHQGKGLMSEAISAIISFGFNELRLHRIEADPLAENERSRRLLERLGFKQEGLLRQRLHYRGEYLDQVYYGLLRHEWNGG